MRKNKNTMEIYKIIASGHPEWCMFCPIVRYQDGKCGKVVKKEKNGYLEQYKAPDRRCLIEIKRVGEND